MHSADLFGGDGVDLVDELDSFFGDQLADDFSLQALVVDVPGGGEGLDVDLFWEK